MAVATYNIKIWADGCDNLTTECKCQTIGRVDDNNSIRLVFERPDSFDAFDMVVFLGDGSNATRVDLGASNEMLLTRAYTQGKYLAVMPAFFGDNDFKRSAATLYLKLGDVLRGGSAPPEPWPDPIQNLNTSAWYGPYEDMGEYLSVKNSRGEEVVQLPVGGGGGGVSKSYVDQQDTATLTAAEAYTDAAGAVLEAAINGTVKLESDTTQVIASDLAIKNGKKVLFEKQNGAHAGGIFMGEYDDGQGGKYEQLEVGTESDPLCLNHNAVSPDGVVVGKNIIVNYKDEDGVAQADAMAYVSDVAISPDAGNTLERRENGLYADAQEGTYSNRNHLLLGDSVTFVESYWVSKYMAKVPVANKVNYAVAGATWCDHNGTVLDGDPTNTNWTNNTMANQVQKVLNNKATNPVPDTIILFAGINDMLPASPAIPEETSVGKYYKSADDTWIALSALNRKNFAEALRWCIETLRGAYSFAEIVLVVPYHTASSTEDNRVNLRNTMLLSEARLSTKMVDLMNTSGISDAFEVMGASGRFLADGIHPNASGATRIANCIYDTVRAVTWEKLTGYTVTNMLLNANFVDATGWAASGVNRALVAANNEMTVTYTGDPGTPYLALFQASVSYIPGHKYYFRASSKASFGAEEWNSNQVFGVSPALNLVYYMIKSADWITLSTLQTAADGAETTYTSFRYYQNIASARNLSGQSVQFREFMLIDVTTTYGAGNEPSKEWCDANIPFFTGTVVL